jgi:hypothetical protein
MTSFRQISTSASAAQGTHCGSAFARFVSAFVAGRKILFCQTKPFNPRRHMVDARAKA